MKNEEDLEIDSVVDGYTTGPGGCPRAWNSESSASLNAFRNTDMRAFKSIRGDPTVFCLGIDSMQRCN